MYTILISIAVGLLVGIGGGFLEWWGWFGGIALGLVAFVATFILIMRRIAKRLRPAMERVKKQAESGMFANAIETVQDMLPLGNWVPLLRGQLLAQLGAFSHYAGQKDKAREYLEAAPNRTGDAKMMLAGLLYREKERDRAIEVLKASAPYNRKSALLYNMLAWILHKEKRDGEAIAMLAMFLKKQTNEPTQDNMLRLQNGKKMTMKPFGMPWYAMGIERPPQSMLQQMHPSMHGKGNKKGGGRQFGRR